MDTGLKGKTVLVTGASRNLGRLTALSFAREGANLAICSRAKIADLNAVADEARAAGVKVVARLCDVTDGGDVARFVAEARSALGGVDVAINLAGFRAEGSLLEESLESWNRAIAVNLTAPFHVCRNVVPHMMEKRWGRIINVSGNSAYLGFSPGQSAVKMGIVGFTRAVAKEFGAHNITANCIGPGAVARNLEAAENEKTLDPNQPVPRKGRTDEVVSLLLYLASDAAGFITGQCYLANGGKYFQ